jgi:hypothetical protein
MLLAGSVGRKGLQEQMHGLNSKQKEHRETQQCRHEGFVYKVVVSAVFDCFRGDDYSSQQDQEDFPNSIFFPFL